MFRRITCLAVLLLSLGAGVFPVARAQDATPGFKVDGVTILVPGESYAGATIGEWDAQYWQWLISFPHAEINPNFDPTGGRCSYGQSGPVFFLPVNFTGEPETITCVVPEGTALLVPIAGAACSTVDPPPYFGRNEEELRSCAAGHADTIMDVRGSINGEPVLNLQRYRSSTPLFPVYFPEDHVFELPEGVASAVAEGYSFIIAPPPPGEYEIVVSFIFAPGSERFGNIYRIIVEAPQVIEPEASPVASPEATPVT